MPLHNLAGQLHVQLVFFYPFGRWTAPSLPLLEYALDRDMRTALYAN